MNESQRQQAIHIMDELIQHPITNLFHNFKNIESSSPIPLDLITIKDKLQNGEIIDIQEWKKLSEECFSYEIKCKENQAKFLSVISSECKKIFEKHFSKLSVNPVESWCSNIIKLHSKQLNFARKPPRTIFSVANQLDSFKKIDNEKIVPLSNAEIKAFMQARNMLQSEDGLYNFFVELQPEIKTSNNTELWVDLTKLDVNTVRTLREYLKSELEKQGDHYPE